MYTHNVQNCQQHLTLLHANQAENINLTKTLSKKLKICNKDGKEYQD